MIKAVLFDLDGTLLPIDTMKYADAYVRLLGESIQHVAPGLPMARIILQSSKYSLDTIAPDLTKRELFEHELERLTGKPWAEFEPWAQRFYDEKAPGLLSDVVPHRRSPEAVRMVRKKGLKCVLATNPCFPDQVTEQRIRAAGLDKEDFDLITTYDNSYFAKPQLGYYTWIAECMGVGTDECAMIGNDTEDDLAAGEVGMKLFWLTDYAICHGEEPACERGSYDEMLSFVEGL